MHANWTQDYYNSTIYIQKSYNFITLLFNTRPPYTHLKWSFSLTQFYAYYLIITCCIQVKIRAYFMCVMFTRMVSYSYIGKRCLKNLFHSNNVKIMLLFKCMYGWELIKKSTYPWKFKFSILFFFFRSNVGEKYFF